MSSISPTHTQWLATPSFAIGAVHAVCQPGDYSITESAHCFGVSNEVHEVEVEGRARALVGPDVVRVHSPGDRIRTRRSGRPGGGCWFVAQREWFEPILVRAGEGKGAPYPFVRPPMKLVAGVRAFFRRVREEGDAIYAAEAADEIVHSLLSVRADLDLSLSRTAVAKRADALLLDGFCSRLQLDTIAAELGVSVSYLARSYRSATGRTVHRQIARLRACEAMRRLDDGANDLSELAFDLGYSSHSHFSADFRRIVGKTPSAYRNRRRAF